VPLEPAEYELTTVVAETGDGEQTTVAGVLADGGVVLLDTGLDDALRAEGYARDVVRVVQDERKAVGLQVTDRIRLALTVPAEQVAAVEEHRAMIGRETLAVEIDVAAGDVTPAVAHVEVTKVEPTATGAASTEPRVEPAGEQP
jgi:isoleucyl-tRNA synthetase